MTIRRRVVAVLVAASVALGGVVGATAFSAGSSSAASTTTNSAQPPPRPGPGANGGRFVPNENPAHEKGESAQREAQENAGQVPTVP